ncbi:MAG: aminotransferase class V-fold PLP-dependent enzyme [Nakamurella sp.]
MRCTAIAADWLTSVWDQNAGLAVMGPAAAVVEEVTGDWLVELFGLPAGTSTGFVTGAQAANVTGLAVGLQTVLERVGWDVAVDGLFGAPRPPILVGAQRHGTVDRALRMLGCGTPEIVEADDQGRISLPALRRALAEQSVPALVCLQAGNVNTGAVDPLREACELVHAAGGWVHVDGAFGLWAAASPQHRALVDGIECADSWATDAHKWLNVPYDSGLVFCADAQAHRRTMSAAGSYLVLAADGVRDGMNYGPEHSRRARGFAVHAALRSLGRRGVTELVDGSCASARRFAEILDADPQVTVLNEVVLNQVLVRFHDPSGSQTGDPTVRADADDAHTRAVIDRIQAEGTCWVGGTIWQGRAAMRISVSGFLTDEQDVRLACAAMLRCADGEDGARADSGAARAALVPAAVGPAH